MHRPATGISYNPVDTRKQTYPSSRFDNPQRPLCIRLGGYIFQLGLDTHLRTSCGEPCGELDDEGALDLVAALDGA